MSRKLSANRGHVEGRERKAIINGLKQSRGR